MNNNTHQMPLEEVKPRFFDPEAIREPSKKLFRITTPGKRYYYTYDENEEGLPIIQIYIGVTSMISALVPKGFGLIKWMVDMGYEKSQAYASMRAAYGTLMHREFERVLINKEYDLDQIPEVVLKYVDKINDLADKTIIDVAAWTQDLTSDMLAFSKWCYDFKVKPIAVEIMLAHPDGYAGTMDLLCYLTIKEKIDSSKRATAGNLITKTIKAAVDFKSGRKGFYDEHAIQLESYRHLIENEWPDMKVDKIYNWSPKDWRTIPGYNFKDQSSSVDAQKFNLIVELAKVELMKVPSGMITSHGIITLDTDPTSLVKEIDIIGYIADNHRKRFIEKEVV